MSKSAKKKTKRHQHTVPKFYLRRFADGERLVRAPIDGTPPRTVGVSDAAVRKDFYSFRGADGQLDDFVEDALAKLEDDAARVLRLAVDEGCWPLPDDAREVMAYWVAAQHLRVPARRQANNEIADHLLKVIAAAGGKSGWRRRMEEAAGGLVSDDEVDRAWAEVSDFSSYEIEAPVEEHLHQMGLMLPQVADVLMQRTWVLVRFQRKTLITSDHPVVQIWDPAIPRWRGQGLANVPAVWMPLDRRAALLMLLPGGMSDRTTAPTAAMAQDLNQRVASSARSAVFHHPDDDLEGIELPEVRTREIQVNGSPEKYLLPDGPPDAFRRGMTDAAEPPSNARSPRPGPDSTR
jgi:hypothetical protein